MNEKLTKTIINRLKHEYSSLVSQEEKIQFGLKYAGHYKLNEFIAYMEDIPLFNENSNDSHDMGTTPFLSHIHKLFKDKEYQKQFILQQREIRNNPTLYEEYLNEYLN
jgi:hypothetical protein